MPKKFALQLKIHVDCKHEFVYIGRMNKNYSVYEANLNTLSAKLTRLNAKLARINIAPITWKQVGHHDEPHPLLPEWCRKNQPYHQKSQSLHR